MIATISRLRIEEFIVPGRRLGRHVRHDSRSKYYRVTPARDPISKEWQTYIPPLDQGALGSCTGNADTAALASDTVFRTLPEIVQGSLNEKMAVSIYSDATALDDYPDQYPPTDTGSDGLSVAKVDLNRGYISGYVHAFSLTDVISGLQKGPMLTGVNWYDSMDDLDVNGTIHISPTAVVRGGHELLIRILDIENQRLKLRNSWGASWGDRGECWIGFNDYERLLSEEGDATLLVPKTEPAPPGPPPDIDGEVLAWYNKTKSWMHSAHCCANKRASKASIDLAKAFGLE